MHDDGIALANAVEHPQRLTARQHVVLADDLEPVDRRMAVENLVIVLRAQPQPETEERRLGGRRLVVCKRRRRTDDMRAETT